MSNTSIALIAGVIIVPALVVLVAGVIRDRREVRRAKERTR